VAQCAQSFLVSLIFDTREQRSNQHVEHVQGIVINGQNRSAVSILGSPAFVPGSVPGVWVLNIPPPPPGYADADTSDAT
jgi:hypothetical protein